jgi:hypothetical protein
MLQRATLRRPSPARTCTAHQTSDDDDVRHCKVT